MESNLQHRFKVVLLSPANNVHTVRWANALSSSGIDVHVISQHPTIDRYHDGVVIHTLCFRGSLGYFSMVPMVRTLLKNIKPDLVNAHYASGYATTARLVGFHPWLLSVWGSDVFEFPYRSFLHLWFLKQNLVAADSIASTSNCMAVQVKRLLGTDRDIHITPFGVDVDFNAVASDLRIERNDNLIVIGTVKSLAETYGIDILIKAFAHLYHNLTLEQSQIAASLRLRLVGSGPQLSYLKQLTSELSIEHLVTFVGRVSYTDVPKELANIDIFVALSRSESFGVAVIEASAAGLPVVVSDVGGLPEVVRNGITGYIVPSCDIEAAARALKELVTNPSLRKKFGLSGFKFVSDNYRMQDCVSKMIDVYQNTYSEYHSV